MFEINQAVTFDRSSEKKDVSLTVPITTNDDCTRLLGLFNLVWKGNSKLKSKFKEG